MHIESPLQDPDATNAALDIIYAPLMSTIFAAPYLVLEDVADGLPKTALAFKLPYASWKSIFDACIVVLPGKDTHT